MKLTGYKETYHRASAKLSEISRYIAFAGIGLIWIFTKETSDLRIPDTLIIPALLLACSLFFDMLQYLLKSIFYERFYTLRRKTEKVEEEKAILKGEEYKFKDYEHPRWWKMVTNICWYLKITLVFIAYGFIIVYLINTLL